VHAYRLIMPGVLVTQLHDDVEHFSVQLTVDFFIKRR
jgi:hypothetical protein